MKSTLLVKPINIPSGKNLVSK